MKNLAVKRVPASAPGRITRLERRQAERREMRLFKRLSIGLIALAVVFTVAASAALAGGNGAQTFTQVLKNIVQLGPADNPCTGDPGTLTTTSNSIFHVTTNATGGEEATLTVTGSALLVPDDPSLPTYTGQFVNHFDHKV